MPVLGSFLIRFRPFTNVEFSKSVFEDFLKWLEAKGYIVYKDYDTVIARSRGELLVMELTENSPRMVVYTIRVPVERVENTEPVTLDWQGNPIIDGRDIVDSTVRLEEEDDIAEYVINIMVPRYTCRITYVCIIDVVDTSFKPSFKIFRKLKELGVQLPVNLVRPM